MLSPKDVAWNEAISRVKQITDKLGMSVDEKIVATVAAFQLLGMETTMSCAGHEERVTGGPYVIFESKTAEEYRKKCAAIKDPRDDAYKEFAYKAHISLLQQQSQLYSLLDAFYRHRSVPFSQRLIIHTLGLHAYRLNAQGAYIALLSKPSMQKTILANSQQEVMAFTDFLKKKYFEN